MRYRVSPANTHGRTSVLSEDGASQVALAGQRIRTALSASLQKMVPNCACCTHVEQILVFSLELTWSLALRVVQ